VDKLFVKPTESVAAVPAVSADIGISEHPPGRVGAAAVAAVDYSSSFKPSRAEPFLVEDDTG
jgi:hypothetical protein